MSPFICVAAVGFINNAGYIVATLLASHPSLLQAALSRVDSGWRNPMRLKSSGLLAWVPMLIFAHSLLLAECEPLPAGLEPWPANKPVPVESIPDDHWFRSSRGWVVAPDRCRAVRVAVEREAAFEAFERHFGQSPMPGAVVDVQYAEAFSALRNAGAGWVLPWRFSPEKDDASPRVLGEDAIRRQIETQLSRAGRSPDPRQVDLLVQRALAKREPVASLDKTASHMLEPKAIRHEVAHMLFLHGVWPSTRSPGAQYGGDAPDWLDEAAAVAAESDGMTEARRAAFYDMARADRLMPLDRYLVMPHPVFGSETLGELMRKAQAAAARDGAAVISAGIGEDRIAAARVFYAQTRGWLDFLTERTGNAGTLGEIADAMREGQSFEHWLGSSAAETGLPKTVPALQAEFESWALRSDSAGAP